MFYVFVQLFQLTVNFSLLLTFFFGLGTLAFPYSTAFYSHLPAAFCSFSSFVIAINICHDKVRQKYPYAFLAGFLAGVGVLVEASAIIMLAIVFVYLVCNKKGRPACFFFIAGCIPAGLVQGYYNATCFGHPLAASYDYANDAVMKRINGSLFGLPTFETLRKMMISPYRGLLNTSPILLMMFPGALFFIMQKQWRSEAVMCVVTSAMFYFFIASFHAWRGGSAPGPRYLLPIYPWFFLLAVWALKKLPRLFIITGCISILINFAITVVGIEIPKEIKNPVFDVILKNITAGKVSINPVPFSHFENYPDIFKLAEIENWDTMQNFNSFNLGELLFPHQLASIIPLLGFWTIWSLCWKRAVSNRKIIKKL
jgi:hypothetical protein